MTESTTSSPHDAVFKTFMFTPETARDFLEIHLPEPLRKLCNLQTLRLEPTSFIEKSLRAYYSDVLWSVETSDGDGYIYCVIEHQSSAEKNMAFRLMRYATAAMQRHLDKGYDRVPLVVPLLFYHGDTSRFTRFIEEIAERSPLQKERLMTIAERLRQEGHQIGWQEGMHEQAIKIALRMLEQGFEREIVLATTQLTDADIPNCH